MSKKGKAPEDERLEDLKQRLDEIQQRSDKAGPDPTDTMAAGFALRAITEILVALAVGTIAGYYLDRYFGTTPWIMIILMPIGQAAGVWNVMRLSHSKQADAILGKAGDEPAKDLKDDDDED